MFPYTAEPSCEFVGTAAALNALMGTDIVWAPVSCRNQSRAFKLKEMSVKKNKMRPIVNIRSEKSVDVDWEMRYQLGLGKTFKRMAYVVREQSILV